MNMKPIVSISIAPETFLKLQEHYSSYAYDNQNEYVIFAASFNEVMITVWKEKKGLHKVTFVGDNALKEAKLWDIDASINKPKKKVEEKWLCFEDQIGSDEVGTGDFFGPMVVVAAYIKAKDIPELIKLGVHDSKKLTDEQIITLGPKLARMCQYSKLTLNNEKYNQMIDKGENMVSLKAKMHNRALLNLVEKYPEVTNLFVDQFVNAKKYYEYLNDPNEKQVKGITFKTKGESYFPCVAVASIIARYSFLMEMKKLSEKYKMALPFGASSKADYFVKQFINKYGITELNKIAKKNFANYKNLNN